MLTRWMEAFYYSVKALYSVRDSPSLYYYSPFQCTRKGLGFDLYVIYTFVVCLFGLHFDCLREAHTMQQTQCTFPISQIYIYKSVNLN